jgi:mannose-1-phosphate guanylyltransferase/mannose-6-phosphate isomerase
MNARDRHSPAKLQPATTSAPPHGAGTAGAAPRESTVASPDRGAGGVHVQAVIMAGGSGTRLWPLSRARHPKQFLALTGNDSLFQQAVKRAGALAMAGARMDGPIIVGNEDHRFMILDQLREIGVTPAAVVLEPMGRNTAPAVALAALQGLEGGHDPVLLVMPSDHAVADSAAFTDALVRAVASAATGDIVILGVEPDRPETGYGYIHAGGPLDDATGAMPVDRFVEKPDAETAARYLAEGGYYWNGGMFVLRASTWKAALELHRPDIAAACLEAWARHKNDGYFIRPDADAFARVPSESVDYAVMERSPGGPWPVHMVPLRAGWNDLGAWDAVWQVAPKDGDGNATVGDALLHDTHNALVHACGRLVSVVGLDNVVVVETADAVMVADRSRSQDVKHLVDKLRAQGREEQALHRQVHRPWGWYDSIDAGERFQVKRIMVKPGAALSLQMHHHRAEHWIVVSGTAEVTCGDTVRLITENQSTYIPLGEKHRLRNPGSIPLEIIEVQSGSYLGEDDIVRFEDVYGRG